MLVARFISCNQTANNETSQETATEGIPGLGSLQTVADDVSQKNIHKMPLALDHIVLVAVLNGLCE